MNPTPHIIESALLLLAAFLIGCVVGYILRKIFNKPTATETATSSAAEAPAAKPAMVSTTGGAAIVTPTTMATKAKTQSKPARPKKAVSATKASTPALASKAAAKTPAKAKGAAPKPVAAKTKPTKPAKPTTSDEPVLLDAPRDGSADDLKKIKGIGPKLEVLLNQNGVYHYDQIATWSAKAVATMDEKLSFKGRIDREKWVSQAQALAKR